MNAKEVCYKVRISVKVDGNEVFHYEVEKGVKSVDMHSTLHSLVEQYSNDTTKTVYIHGKEEKVVYLRKEDFSKTYYYAPDTQWFFAFYPSGRCYATKEKTDYLDTCLTGHHKDGMWYSQRVKHYKTEKVYDKEWTR